MKKLSSLACLALLMCQAFVPASANTSYAGQSYGKQSPQQSMALLLPNLKNPFFIAMKEGAEARAANLGYQLIVVESKNNLETELNYMELFTLQGVDGLLYVPINSEIAINRVKMANRLEIPLVTLDRKAIDAEVTAHIGGNNLVGGRMAGDFIAKQLGTDIQVIILQGEQTTSSAQERQQGFMLSARENHFDLIATKVAAFDRRSAQQATHHLLRQHRGVKAIFAQNDEMAIGASQAVKASGRKVMVVGYDGTEAGIKAVKEGQIAATMAQRADVIGQKGVDTLNQAIRGQTVKAEVAVPLRMIVPN